MARDKQKDARDRATARLEGRPKALRRELTDLETELERARKRRDRAQARVEALEAIAEQLTVALASAEAARDRRRTRREDAETASATTDHEEIFTGAPSDTQAAAPVSPRGRKSRAKADVAVAVAPSGDTVPADDQPVLSGVRAKSARAARASQKTQPAH